MTLTTNFTPELLVSFQEAIKHLKGSPATDANKKEGRAIIEYYTGRLQLLDLELSQADARAILATEYSKI